MSYDNTYKQVSHIPQVWTGSRLLIETLAWPNSNDCNRLKEIQQFICQGAKLIELGAGVGVVGTYLSSIGAEVLLTDLSTLVENAIDNNLARNATTQTDDNPHPSWLAPSDGVPIGKGWAASASLDWTCRLDEQLTIQQSSVDFIIASDVVFLSSMLNSLLKTVESIFQSSSGSSFILSFQRRDAKDGAESSLFTTVDGVIDAIKTRGWKIDCLAWRPVIVSREASDGNVSDVETEVFVFEISWN